MRISILLLPLLFTVATLAEPEAAPAIVISSKSSTKSNEKPVFPKKVTSLKKRPTKSSAITENTAADTKIKKPLSATVFKNLTADDLDFIKELDHQFSVHGEKIKIKVERTNSTGTKNPKRTIDGELGYGYSHNGYEYERPKFMFYPYSQKDISSDSPGYYPKEEHTSVTIEPSYSYELKPQTYEEAPHQPQIDLPTPGVPQYSAHGSDADGAHQPQQQYYQEPVIVLRIPGPAKYASHLQSLLQQYLEIRAAQYLRILENSELEQHQQPDQHVDYQPQQEHAVAPQQYEQPPQHVDYQSPQAQEYPDTHQQYEQQPQHESHADYHQQLTYTHQIATTPQPNSYPTIDDVYHSYKERHQQQQQQHQQAETYAAPAQQPQQEQYYHQTETAYHAPAAPQATADVVPQYYYMHDQHYAESPHSGDGGSNAQSYQHVYVIAMSSPHASSQQLYAAPVLPQTEQHQHQMQHPIYVQDEHQAHANDQEQHFPITENSPRETHTKVYFSTHSSEQNSHDYSMHMLPSIRPYDRHAPASTPTYQQHAEESAPSAVSGADQHAVEYQQALVAPQHEVAITQRPHNYHAHPHKPKGRTRISTKRAATPVNDGTDKHLEQIHAYVANKLGAKMGAQESFKTTKIING